MSQNILSSAWYRVAGLQPRLRSHARIHRHEYRGERWYVMDDRLSRRSHRFSPEAYFVIGLMNGHRTMQEIWEAVVVRHGDEVPTQDEVMRLLGQLHLADLMQCDATPDVEELLRRSHRLAQRNRIARLVSPLAIRIPLFDPERLLVRWQSVYQSLFGRVGALLWILVVGWAMMLAFQHWSELVTDISDRILAPQNLLLIAIVFPLLKAAHEFGHACAVKAWGGEVHEMGVMLLVLMPIPYVDASAASSFPQRYRRALVGAAGMVVEVFLAALAMIIWVEMQPGLLRAVLFNVMLVAGVTTVLFNANPLLRFDGYYILGDLLEIPNLRQRANGYLTGLLQQWLYGLPSNAPEASFSEKAWFVSFTVAAFFYRFIVTFGIAVFVSTQYFFVGVLLGVWAIAAAVVLPLFALVAYVGFSPRLRRRRTRAIMATSLVVTALYVLFFIMPVPAWTNVQGVVWLPEQAAVRARTDGFVATVMVAPGERVTAGQPLMRLTDPALPLRLRALEARKTELESRYQSERQERLVRSQITLEQLKTVEAELFNARERSDALLVTSPRDGEFALHASQDLPGRYVRQGEPVGHVVSAGVRVVRVVVPQEWADLVRSRTNAVRVRFPDQREEALNGQIVREMPKASNTLPSPALAHAGGGEVALDPTAENPGKTLQTHFGFEIEVPGISDSASSVGIGSRVHVRFEHGSEPLATQVWRALRQMFLRLFTL